MTTFFIYFSPTWSRHYYLLSSSIYSIWVEEERESTLLWMCCGWKAFYEVFLHVWDELWQTTTHLLLSPLPLLLLFHFSLPCIGKASSRSSSSSGSSLSFFCLIQVYCMCECVCHCSTPTWWSFGKHLELIMSLSHASCIQSFLNEKFFFKLWVFCLLTFSRRGLEKLDTCRLELFGNPELFRYTYNMIHCESHKSFWKKDLHKDRSQLVNVIPQCLTKRSSFCSIHLVMTSKILPLHVSFISISQWHDSTIIRQVSHTYWIVLRPFTWSPWEIKWPPTTSKAVRFVSVECRPLKRSANLIDVIKVRPFLWVSQKNPLGNLHWEQQERKKKRVSWWQTHTHAPASTVINNCQPTFNATPVNHTHSDNLHNESMQGLRKARQTELPHLEGGGLDPTWSHYCSRLMASLIDHSFAQLIRTTAEREREREEEASYHLAQISTLSTGRQLTQHSS